MGVFNGGTLQMHTPILTFPLAGGRDACSLHHGSSNSPFARNIGMLTGATFHRS